MSIHRVPTSIKEYRELEPETLEETAYIVRGARVVWADYEKIACDFPFFNSSRADLEGEINNWLINNCAVMSSSQLRNAIGIDPNNSDMVVRPVKAYRPPWYGRALIFQANELMRGADNNGQEESCEVPLIDIKGVGVGPEVIPDEANPHKSGWIHLPMALYELASQKLVERVFKKYDLDVKGVPIYAVLDIGPRTKLPVWVRGLNFSNPHPVSVVVRQGHIRPAHNQSLPKHGSEQQQAMLFVELLLRRYGITSCLDSCRIKIAENEGKLICKFGSRVLTASPRKELERIINENQIALPATFDTLTLQITRFFTLRPFSVRLIDFGQYTLKSSFKYPLLSMVSDRAVNWGGTICPGSENWVVPDEIYAGERAWGEREFPEHIIQWAGIQGVSKSKIPGFLIFGFEMAKIFEEQNIPIEKINLLIEAFISQVMVEN
jgi:hypothetical protein